MRVVFFIHHSRRHFHSSIFWNFIFRVCSHVHFQSLVQNSVTAFKNPRLEDLHILIMVPRGDSLLSSKNIPKEAGDLNIEFLEWQKDALQEKLLLYRENRLVEEKDDWLIDEMEENFVFVSLAEDVSVNEEEAKDGEDNSGLTKPTVQSSMDELVVKQFNRKLALISYYPASYVSYLEDTI